MDANDEKDRWKNLREEKIEPPPTTRNDRIRLAFFLVGILLAIILIIFILAKYWSWPFKNVFVNL